MGAVAIAMIALGVLILVWVYRDVAPPSSSTTAPTSTQNNGGTGRA